MHFNQDFFDVEDDIRHVLSHTGESGKFVEHPFDANGRNRGSLKRREKNPAQGVSDGDSESSFEGFDMKTPVSGS
jgi:hypothetical protein